jgi:hypothetical protein
MTADPLREYLAKEELDCWVYGTEHSVSFPSCTACGHSHIGRFMFIHYYKDECCWCKFCFPFSRGHKVRIFKDGATEYLIACSSCFHRAFEIISTTEVENKPFCNSLKVSRRIGVEARKNTKRACE